MNATGYIEVLEAGLQSYLNSVDPKPRFMQDNDPKHTSRRAVKWIEDPIALTGGRHQLNPQI